jgi:hypothetical protein
MLSKVKAISDFVPRAKRKIMFILNALSKINCCEWNVFVKIFDTQIVSGLLYGCEIWGTGIIEEINRVQSFAIKRFLKLNIRTPTAIVYGETGRYPLHVNYFVRCVKYWFKLLKLNPDRLPQVAYRCSYSLTEKGKECWASRVKLMLFQYGFGEAWYNQGVGSEVSFLRLFRQRVQDCFEQNWHDTVMSTDRLGMYSAIKQTFGKEKHLIDIEAKYRSPLLKIRAGVSWIKVHRLRNIENADLSCPCCPGKVEDEVHVLFKCKLYDTLRPDILKCESHFYKNRLETLLMSKNTHVLKCMSIFLHQAFKLNINTSM